MGSFHARLGINQEEKESAVSRILFPREHSRRRQQNNACTGERAHCELKSQRRGKRSLFTREGKTKGLVLRSFLFLILRSPAYVTGARGRTGALTERPASPSHHLKISLRMKARQNTHIHEPGRVRALVERNLRYLTFAKQSSHASRSASRKMRSEDIEHTPLEHCYQLSASRIPSRDCTRMKGPLVPLAEKTCERLG